MIEVTIICDRRTGNPLEKELCHSDARYRGTIPRREKDSPKMAVHYAERQAERLGWTRKIQPMQFPLHKWTCPVCQKAP